MCSLAIDPVHLPSEHFVKGVVTSYPSVQNGDAQVLPFSASSSVAGGWPSEYPRDTDSEIEVGLGMRRSGGCGIEIVQRLRGHFELNYILRSGPEELHHDRRQMLQSDAKPVQVRVKALREGTARAGVGVTSSAQSRT